ncbi:MAG: response regulator transcription factor [Ruminococcaceae bacterium]|nr:response regulator transcription factor [Oscillospiraceae bacterium]
MNIAICDKNNGEQIKNETLCFLDKKDIEGRCFIFKKDVDLLASNEIFDIVILDTDFSDISSAQIINYLKRYNNEAAIIIVSDDYARLNEAFDVGARRYLIKPIDETFFSALESVIEYLKTETTECYIEDNGTIKRISKSSIIYLEISGRKTKIVTNNECYFSKLKMQDFQKILNPAQFASPHKSFYVNLGQINECLRFGGQYYLCMSDNKYIPITRTRKADFEKTYLQYLKRKNLM